jgi:hypothetical protein
MVAIDAVATDTHGACDTDLFVARPVGRHMIMAEIKLCRTAVQRLFRGRLDAGLPLVVRTLKCEVRAFGGCLGMQRR